MARPLSEEKRMALLNAAVDTVAELGLGAPTVKIAKRAGVGDGTLFVYFPNKETLFNQLYLYIKEDLRRAVQIGTTGSVEERLREFWDRYIEWGIKYPRKYRATRYLNASEAVTDETRKAVWALFAEFEVMVDQGMREGVLRRQPKAFLGELIDAVANMVLEFAQKNPGNSQEFKRLGWDAFWGGIHG